MSIQHEEIMVAKNITTRICDICLEKIPEYTQFINIPREEAPEFYDCHNECALKAVESYIGAQSQTDKDT